MIGRSLYWTAVTLLTAGCTHLALVLAIPYTGQDDGFTRLSTAAHDSRLRTLALPDDATAPPFADPAQATAFCLYDLGAGPVTVSLEKTDVGFTTLAVVERHGRIVSGLTARPVSPHRLDLVLMTPEQAARRPPGPATGSPLRVTVQDPQGLVLAMVLAGTSSERPAARAAALGLSCRAAGKESG